MDVKQKQCTRCGENKSPNLFPTGRNICTKCKVKQTSEGNKRKKEQLLLLSSLNKTCNQCQISKSIQCFETNRGTCKECRNKQKTIATKTRTENILSSSSSSSSSELPLVITLNNGRVHIGSELPKQCNTCLTPFHPDTFKYRHDRKYYDSLCKACYNGKKYYDKYRENCRATDEEKYLANNAKVHREYVKMHPEINEQNSMNIATKQSNKLSSMRTAAKKQKKQWVEEDEEAMKVKLGQPCSYCGVTVEEMGGILTGLGRIDNDLGYSDANTAPACFACNRMKHILGVPVFLSHCARVAAFNVDNPVLLSNEELCKELVKYQRTKPKHVNQLEEEEEEKEEEK
jgi:hypothetical protein